MDNITTSVEINDAVLTTKAINDANGRLCAKFQNKPIDPTRNKIEKTDKAKKPHFPPENVRFHRMLDAIWAVAATSGFRINSRIEAVDIKSGKEFK